MNRLTSKKVKDYMSWRTDEELKHCPDCIAQACNEACYEFNINYDNKIELENLSYNDSYELVEAIVTKIEKQFKVEEKNA